MSILHEIEARVIRGHLVEIPIRDLRSLGGTYRRWLYVSSTVNEEINRRFNEPAFRRLSAQFQNFIRGAHVPVAINADHKGAEWARLQLPSDEVWEHRVRYVSPELRIMG